MEIAPGKKEKDLFLGGVLDLNRKALPEVEDDLSKVKENGE